MLHLCDIRGFDQLNWPETIWFDSEHTEVPIVDSIKQFEFTQWKGALSDDDVHLCVSVCHQMSILTYIETESDWTRRSGKHGTRQQGWKTRVSDNDQW